MRPAITAGTTGKILAFVALCVLPGARNLEENPVHHPMMDSLTTNQVSCISSGCHDTVHNASQSRPGKNVEARPMKVFGLGIQTFICIASALIIVGAAVELVSMRWVHPLAFVLFAFVAVPLIGLGILIYLISLVLAASPTAANFGQDTPTVASEFCGGVGGDSKVWNHRRGNLGETALLTAFAPSLSVPPCLNRYSA